MISSQKLAVALLTGGRDPQYALGLAPALADAEIEVEMVGGSEMAEYPRLRHPNINFLNLRKDQSIDAPLVDKVRRVVLYYWRLLWFAHETPVEIFHILWPNKFVLLDRTLVALYYRLLGKRLVLTAHNVNTEERDGRDSWLNRLSLRIQYGLMDRVFVHTPEMRDALVAEYGVSPSKICVVPFPLNNVTPQTGMHRNEARARLGIPFDEKVLLFFGNIARYKGVDDLVRCIPLLSGRLGAFKLLVVGSIKVGEEDYFRNVCDLISKLGLTERVDLRIAYIPEDQVELYFAAADLLVLPYRRISQSGVLFLSYGFGLPVVATDAGSLKDAVLTGKTGFVCKQGDPASLAEEIIRYFDSDLFAELETRRRWIIEHVRKTYRWEYVAEKSREVYETITGEIQRTRARSYNG
jgi:glycosyltransferase involved in cell wall biosynthesis